jgi:hypothetical protein
VEQRRIRVTSRRTVGDPARFVQRGFSDEDRALARMACILIHARDMRTTTILASALVLVPVIAGAEPQWAAPRTASIGDLVRSERTANDITFVRKLLPPTGIDAVAQSRIIYLNHTGVTLLPGDDDSRTNRSSIINGQKQVPAWNASPQLWSDTVKCMKDMFSRWDVTITDVDPGNVPHMEAVFGGGPGSIGMPAGVGGVSPFTETAP